MRTIGSARSAQAGQGQVERSGRRNHRRTLMARQPHPVVESGKATRQRVPRFGLGTGELDGHLGINRNVLTDAFREQVLHIVQSDDTQRSGQNHLNGDPRPGRGAVPASMRTWPGCPVDAFVGLIVWPRPDLRRCASMEC